MAQPLRYLSTYGKFISNTPLTYQDRYHSYPIDPQTLLDPNPPLETMGALVNDDTIGKIRFFTDDVAYRTFMRNGVA